MQRPSRKPETDAPLVEWVTATANVFTAAPTAADFFELDKTDAALAEYRTGQSDAWVAKMAQATAERGDDPAYAVDVTVTGIDDLAVPGERACIEMVTVVTDSFTGRERSLHQRSIDLRVGRLRGRVGGSNRARAAYGWPA